MQNSKMKNIVVLKNLPSNLIDEAIVILKANKNAKTLQYIENNSKKEYENRENSKEYAIREAESVISNYISKIENNKKIKNQNRGVNKKYNGLKRYSICVSIILFVCIIKIIL